MVYGGLDAATTFDFYQWHKSFGFVALALTAVRLVARLAGAAPRAPASPLGAAPGRGDAGLLYILTIGAIGSGWLLVSASPLPVPTRFFDLFVIPNIAPADPSLFASAELAHKLLAWAIALLVALHVAGALKHHFVDRDDVLKHMTSWRPDII